ncbi:MAG: ABC transporter ATP-binding protein [Acidobacteria bacterium]|nr:MAG: ABC transporter ATP-binding protein [Acidobacteriota bacterium]
MIRAVNLTKRYEDGTLGLDALNLSVECGQIYCLLGAPGAGKSTIINLFLGFIRPSSGQALVSGIDVDRNPIEAKRHISYLPENALLYDNYNARQTLEFFAGLAGISHLRRDDYNAILREVGLKETSFEQPLKHLSTAMRQKVAVAAMLLKGGPAVLLDEPIAGLDPRAVADVLDVLRRLRNQGKAILFSTHDIFRAREIADRIGIIREGRKVLERGRDEIDDDDLHALYLNYIRGSR